VRFLWFILAAALAMTPISVMGAKSPSSHAPSAISSHAGGCGPSAPHDAHKRAADCFVTVCMAMTLATPVEEIAVLPGTLPLLAARVHLPRGFDTGLDPPPPRLS
jgi:hypothetical protein